MSSTLEQYRQEELSRHNVYVVKVDESTDSDQSSYILGVYATKEAAQESIKPYIENILKCTEYDTINEDEMSWEGYNEGWYADDHYSIIIYEEDVKGGENGD